MAIGKPIRPDGHCALLSDQGNRNALENLPQRPKLASATSIPQEWLNLALSDATAAAVQTLRAGAPIQGPSWL